MWRNKRMETITRILGLLPWSSECRSYHGGREQRSIPEGRLCLGATQTEGWIHLRVCVLWGKPPHTEKARGEVGFGSFSYLWVSLGILPSPSETPSRLPSPSHLWKNGTSHSPGNRLWRVSPPVNRLLVETARSLRGCQFMVVLSGKGNGFKCVLDSAWALGPPGSSSHWLGELSSELVHSSLRPHIQGREGEWTMDLPRPLKQRLN